MFSRNNSPSPSLLGVLTPRATLTCDYVDLRKSHFLGAYFSHVQKWVIPWRRKYLHRGSKREGSSLAICCCLRCGLLSPSTHQCRSLEICCSQWAKKRREKQNYCGLVNFRINLEGRHLFWATRESKFKSPNCELGSHPNLPLGRQHSHYCHINTSTLPTHNPGTSLPASQNWRYLGASASSPVSNTGNGCWALPPVSQPLRLWGPALPRISPPGKSAALC